MLEKPFEIKMAFYRDTCEQMASLDKLSFIIKNTSYFKDSKRKCCDFDDISNMIQAYNEYHNIDEEIIRDICKNDPWKTIWSIRSNVKTNWFSYPKREMTSSQKMLIAWSQTYDNVYESMEAPTQDVINDDFLLDGWFISQTRKKKTQSIQSDIDSDIRNEKIKNSSEIFKVVGRNTEEAKRINKANTPHAQMIKKQRDVMLKRNGNDERIR